jgi:hypothetical protein
MSLHFRDIVSQEEQLTAEISALEKQIAYLERAFQYTKQDEHTLKALQWFLEQHQKAGNDIPRLGFSSSNELVEQNLKDIPSCLESAKALLKVKKEAFEKINGERKSREIFFAKIDGKTSWEIFSIIQKEVVAPIDSFTASIKSATAEMDINTKSIQEFSQRLWQMEGLDTQNILTLIELKIKIDSLMTEWNKKLLEEYKNYDSIARSVSQNPRHKYVSQKVEEIEEKSLFIFQQLFELHKNLRNHKEISQEIIWLFEKVWNFIAILDKWYINSSNKDSQPVTHMFWLSDDKKFIVQKTITHLGRELEQTVFKNDEKMELIYFKPIWNKRFFISLRSTDPKYINTNELVS